MPVYKLGPTPGGGYRSVLPPDPEKKSSSGTVLACAISALMGLGGGFALCALLDDEATRETVEQD
jgi:hypothetical protein